MTTQELPAFEVGALVSRPAAVSGWSSRSRSRPTSWSCAPWPERTTRSPGVFPALEQVSPATFAPPDPQDIGTAASAGLLRTALRIGFRASAGPFRSLARLAVEPRAYQLVPLLMALRQDTVRLLIADDVGIGKTVEAGLAATELLEQGDASGLAVLCGPALAEQWQQELASKFGIHAELVLPGTIRRLERGLLQGETLFDRFRHIVVSTDFIKRPGLREQFWHGCPDLLIIDEAHTCVSDGTGGRSRMLRHELVTGLAKNAARHLILVTATPHSGKEDGFRNLLALLDPDLASRGPRIGRRAGSGSPVTSCSAGAATSAPIRARRRLPGGPAEPGTALPAVPGLQRAVRRRARSTPARPSGIPTAASCGSGSGTGRRWRCCGRWRPRRGRPPPRCAPGPPTLTPPMSPKPTGLAARRCLTSPTRRPSSPLTPPRARTARPRRVTRRTAGG